MRDKKALRIIDANLNRAREGLRVCEDITRFILNDSASMKKVKAVRHNVYRIASESAISGHILCAWRDTKKDVGIEIDSLDTKMDWQSIFFANMQRAKESLRVLEEFFNLFDRAAGEAFKALRFDIYALEKNIITGSKPLSNYKRNLCAR